MTTYQPPDGFPEWGEDDDDEIYLTSISGLMIGAEGMHVFKEKIHPMAIPNEELTVTVIGDEILYMGIPENEERVGQIAGKPPGFIEFLSSRTREGNTGEGFIDNVDIIPADISEVVVGHNFTIYPDGETFYFPVEQDSILTVRHGEGTGVRGMFWLKDNRFSNNQYLIQSQTLGGGAWPLHILYFQKELESGPLTPAHLEKMIGIFCYDGLPIDHWSRFVLLDRLTKESLEDDPVALMGQISILEQLFSKEAQEYHKRAMDSSYRNLVDHIQQQLYWLSLSN